MLGEQRIFERDLSGFFVSSGREEQFAQVVAEVRLERLAAVVRRWLGREARRDTGSSPCSRYCVPWPPKRKTTGGFLRSHRRRAATQGIRLREELCSLSGVAATQMAIGKLLSPGFSVQAASANDSAGAVAKYSAWDSSSH